MKAIDASIIINTYNGNQDHLVEAVTSCVNQAGCKIQMIVSTVVGDPSIDTLSKMNFDVEVVKNKKPGIYSQLNNAVKKIKNEWWCYISGNDVMHPNKIFQEANLCNKFGKKVCYSGFDVTDCELNFMHQKRFHNYSFTKNLEGNFINDAALIHKSLSDKYCPFTEEFDNLGYWDFWLRIGRDNPKCFVYNPNSVFSYRLCNDSRHIKRKADKTWRKKELEDRRRMLSRFGKLRGKYAR
jgi:glycosyltransferase involved in cell wall biosynthesis